MTEADLPVQAIRRAALDRRDLVTGLRRALHEIPELAFQEVETTRQVAEFLKSRGVAFEVLPWGTGGIAVLGAGSGPAVLLRADLDALPVHEAGTCSFRSKHPGRMHACGHDAHAAMLLAAADALASGDVPFSGRVLCFFQPAEEGPGGCVKALEAGLLERHPCRAAVALHVWPGLPTGTVGLSPGPVMAGMDRVHLTFLGKGGHGAHPEACIDPVVMAAGAVLSLQTLVSRTLDPLQPGLLTLGSIHGGTAPNIIPDTVEVDGTIRYYEAAVRASLLDGIRRVGSGVAAAHGGSFELRFDEGYPVTRNDPAACAAVSEALRSVLGGQAVVPARPTMGAEDMAYLLDRVPGCYLQLGSSADPASAEPLHSPRFNIDDDCLVTGVTALLTAAAALAPG